MDDWRDLTLATDGAGALLAQALSYAVGNVAVVTPDLLWRPTPCRGWDLRMLLRHGCESLAALAEGFASGNICLAAADEGVGVAEPVGLFVARARSLLGCRPGQSEWPAVGVGGRPLATGVVTAAGALEIAVHGWDIAQASGSKLAIPAALARRLLEMAPVLVTAADRPPLFAAAVPVGPQASFSQRLTAFLGRRPD